MSTYSIDALGTKIAVRIAEEGYGNGGSANVGHVIDKGDEVTLRLAEGDVICFYPHAGIVANLGTPGGSVLLIDQADVLAKRVEVSA